MFYTSAVKEHNDTLQDPSARTYTSYSYDSTEKIAELAKFSVNARQTRNEVEKLQNVSKKALFQKVNIENNFHQSASIFNDSHLTISFEMLEMMNLTKLHLFITLITIWHLFILC